MNTTTEKTAAEKLDPDDPLKRADYASAEEVAEFLIGLGSSGEAKFELFRKSPPTHRGIQVAGHLRNYSDPFTLEEIQIEHGGGKFQVRAQKRDSGGRWKYAGARTFEIAGVPKIDALKGPEDDSGHGRNTDNNPAVGQALNMARALVEDSREQAREARADRGASGGMDEGTRMIIDGMNAQLAELRAAMTSKDAKILELVGQKPDTSGQDKLLGIMEKSTTDHSSRIAEVRIAHDTELRQLRDFHNQDLKQREGRFEKELDAVRHGHQREIDSLKDAHRTAMESQKTAYEMRIDTLKDQSKRGERELTEARAEVGTLRAKKDLGPMEQLQTIVALKNGMESVFPSPDDEPSKLQQIVSGIAESPIVQSIAARIEGGAPGAPSGEEQMVQVRDREGKIHTVPASYVRQMQAQQQAQTAAGGADQPPPLDPREVKQAVAFLETAYSNGHAPEMVAATARNLVPANILAYLKKVGIDEFLKEMGTADNSPLATVAGRMWVRGVAQVLLQGYVDPQETEPPAPAETTEADDLDFDAAAALDEVDADGEPGVG